jgi:hypothetical protein
MASDGPTPAERGPGYEFTPEQNTVVGETASKMKLVGLIMLVFGVINLANAVLFQVAFHHLQSESIDVDVKDKLVSIDKKDRWIITGYLTVVGAVLACVGAWTRSAASSFTAISKTSGQGVNHLMAGFKTMNKMYSLIATVQVAAILACLVLIVYKAMGVVN